MNNDVMSFKGGNKNSNNYNITEFIQSEDKNITDKDQSYKRKINFEEERNIEDIPNTIKTTIRKNVRIEVEDPNTTANSSTKSYCNIPYVPAIELKTPPHYKFNQLKSNSSSFASCFVPNPNELNMYKPISTTNINQNNDNMFRSPNLRKKINLENKNAIENIKFKESSNNPLSQKLPKIICNCKKSKCLKLYCECFILGLYCDGCNCSPCFNTVANAEERNKIMESLKEKNPAAFKPKIDFNIIDEEKQKIEKNKHIRGCNCSKTQCIKKYKLM
jgi:hypothetical protein